MSDSVVATSASSPVAIASVPSEKKIAAKKSGKAKKPSTPSSHPPTQQMVDASIKDLKERGGSSLLAIKKYISATYKCDAQKLAPFIKKYLKAAVVSGKLIQTKGKGASGSFKLSAAARKEPKSPKVVKSIEKKTKKSGSGSSVIVSKKKSLSVTKKTGGVGEKKSKKVIATSGKKSADKKKIEKSNAKSIQKAGTIKTKTVKAKVSATKPKSSTKAKVSAIKSKKVTPAAKKAVLKKPAAKKLLNFYLNKRMKKLKLYI